MAAGPPAGAALSRSLTRRDLVVIGVAQIIGAGIFVISGVGVRIAGPGILSPVPICPGPSAAPGARRSPRWAPWSPWA